jgi:heme exporter protein C
MKYVLMLGGVLLGVALGFMPRRAPWQQKPLWWRALAVLAVTVTVVLALMPPIAGNMRDVVTQSRIDSTKIVPALVRLQDGRATLQDSRSNTIVVAISAATKNTVANVPTDVDVVLGLKRASSDAIVDVVHVHEVAPWITLPYIIGLEERARIIFFHVPMSWVAIIAYLISMVFAIRYMSKRDIEMDDVSASAASVGTLFTILATVTGSVWAKFNWGTFWNWDPRESSIFILLLIYASYFLLRSAIEDPERRARLSAVYSVIAFLTAPFLMFILPRLVPGLHPGSADDTNAGPLLSPKSSDINLTKQVVFGLSLFAFTLVYFWLMNLHIRTTRLVRMRVSKESLP